MANIHRHYVLGLGWRYIASVGGNRIGTYGTRAAAAVAIGRCKAARARLWLRPVTGLTGTLSLTA